MASECKVSTIALNAACNAIVDLVDAAAGPGHLVIFDDALAIPANCESTLTSNPLVDLELQKPGFNTSEEGVAYALFVPGPHPAVDSGTAAYFRFYDDNTNCVLQGTVGDGDDLPVDLRVENKSFQLSGAVQGYLFRFEMSQLPDVGEEVDDTPDAFSFTAITNGDVNTAYVFGPILVQGIDQTDGFQSDNPLGVDVTITNARYRINGGPWQTIQGTARLFDSIEVEVTSAGTGGTLTTGTLNIGGVTADANVTTVGVTPDSTPDPFAFQDQTNAPLSTEYTSNSITISGINVIVPFTVVGGSWSKNGGSFVAGVANQSAGPSGTVVNGDTLRLRVTSSSSYSAEVTSTLYISSLFDEYKVTTQAAPAPDATPDPWTYSPATNVPVSTVIESEGHTPTGINTNMPVSVNFGEFKINDFAWRSTPVNMIPGSIIRVRHTSSGSNSTTTTQHLSCNNGAVIVPFAVTTEASTGAGITSLASPSWLLDAEDFLGAKVGIAYYETDYRTQFLGDTGAGTVVTVSTQSELLTQIAAAKSNSAISIINLNPGPGYSISGSSNPVNALNRPANNPLVLRTTPGAASQATMLFSYSGGALSGLALVDLHFPTGCTIAGQNNGIVTAPKNILIERCTFAYVGTPISGGQGACQLTVQGSWSLPTSDPDHETTAFAENIIVRLNVFYGSSSVTGSSTTQNFFNFGTKDMLVEGNIFDHGGWLPQYGSFPLHQRRPFRGGSNPGPYDNTGPPTVRKHNVYFHTLSDRLVVRYNMVVRASSHGLHCKGGGRVYRNLCCMCPIAIQIGYGSDNLNALFGMNQDAVCNDNAIIGGEDVDTEINPSDGIALNQRGVGVWFTNSEGLVINNNRMLYLISASTGNAGMFIPESSWPLVDVTVSNNRSYSWGTAANYINPRGNNAYIPDITYTANQHNVPTISSAASQLALAIGGSTNRAIGNAYWDAYQQSRRRLGVDIRDLQQNFLAVIFNGFN